MQTPTIKATLHNLLQFINKNGLKVNGNKLFNCNDCLVAMVVITD